MIEIAKETVARSPNTVRDHLDLAAMALATLMFFAVVSIMVSYVLWFCLP